MLVITPIEKSEVTRLACKECGEKLRGVGLRRDSKIDGLSFKCKRCGKLWSVKTQEEKK